MITCTVEFYGLAGEIAGRKEAALSLGESRAGIPEIVATLRKEVPALDEIVLQKEQDLLADNQVLNVDGRFYQNGDELDLKDGDRIRLLTIATGG